MSNISESLEDYLEAIYLLSQELKVVRLKDLMNYLNYKVSSVNSAIKHLSQKGLVEHEKYGYIELTAEGSKIAKQIYSKHKSLYNFFHNILGVDKNIAEKDACKIEHNLSCDTYTRFIGFIKFIKQTHSNEEILNGINKIKKSFKEKIIL